MQDILFLGKDVSYPPKKEYSSIYPGIYVKDNADADIAVREKFFEILAYVMKWTDWYISDASALLLTFNKSDEFYVRSSSTPRKVRLWKFKIIVNPLDAFALTDTMNPTLGIRKLSVEHAVLQNLVETKSNPTRTLPRESLIDFIRKYHKGIKLDRIEEVAKKNKRYKTAKSRFFEIYGKILWTKQVDENENSVILLAKKDGLDVDYERVKKFQTMFKALSFFETRNDRRVYFEDDNFLENLSFFESYFSNYIEGSKFVIEEAKKIIEKWEEYERKTQDTHNVLDLYNYLVKFYRTYRKNGFPKVGDFETFKKLIRSVHKGFGFRTIPGSWEFKTANNMNSSGYRFVDVAKLEWTLRYGFELWTNLSSNVKKGLFYHYVLSECHPFNDGNWRLSRTVLNYYFLLDGHHPIMVTSKIRTGYLRALSDISRNDDPNYYLRFFENLIDRMWKVDFLVPVLKNDLMKDVVYDDNVGWFDLFSITGN